MGLAIQHEILASHQLFRSPCASNKPRLRVLALAAATDMGSNTPIEFLLEESGIELMTLYVVPDVELPAPLPDHDVAIVIASDSEDCRDALRKIDAAAPRWPRPLLNPPALRLQSRSRQAASPARRHRRLDDSGDGWRSRASSLEDVTRSARSARRHRRRSCFSRHRRPRGSHAGDGLAKIDDGAALARYLDSAAG